MQIDRNLICICSLIKDEHDYIEEWIEYHHNIGINQFYLIEDYCSQSHEDILKKYDYVKLYQLKDMLTNLELKILNKKFYRQKFILSIFNRNFRKNNQWMAMIDVDEFIDCDKQRLYNILEKNNDKPFISMRWKTMKCNGHISHPYNGNKYSILDTYTDYNYSINNLKQILNCNTEFIFNIYQKWENFPHVFKKSLINTKDNLELRHYLCKSFEEWIKRLSDKGEIVKANWNRQINDWFKVNPEFKNQKEEIYKKYNANLINIKYNDYS